MADFNKVIPLVLKHEGGYVNNPNDPGGATNYGISLRFAQGTGNTSLFDVDGSGKVDINDIKKLNKETAVKIYKKYFWDESKIDYDSLSDTVAHIVFDSAVNMGDSQATKLVQRTLNEMGNSLEIDGVAGTKTNTGLKNADVKTFISKFNLQRINYYQNLAKKRPSYKTFLRGWLNRCSSTYAEALNLL